MEVIWCFTVRPSAERSSSLTTATREVVLVVTSFSLSVLEIIGRRETGL